MNWLRYWENRSNWMLCAVAGEHRWYGIARHEQDGIEVDLGRYRVNRRGKWTPLMAEVHTWGPVQWWSYRTETDLPAERVGEGMTSEES